MRLIKLFFAVSLLVNLCFDACAQVGITAYTHNALAFHTSERYRLGVECKTYLNLEFDEFEEIQNIDFELAAMYHFRTKKPYRFSAGFGVSAAPWSDDEIYGVFVPLQFQCSPLQECRNLSFVIELSPHLSEVLSFRYLLGIRYTFGKLE